jgi:tetratricopeptide (TPR) repeat protein
VASVLEGSVGRDGDRLRVRVRLVDAARGHQLWGDTYDRVLTDVFAVQEGIAREVVAALQVRLGAVPGGRLVRGQTADPEAFELYLKGRHLWNQRTGPSLTAALRHFEEAIAVDSMFALAHAALADTYLLLPEYAGGRTRDVAPQVVAAAVRAIELDPSLAEPYVTLGSLYQRSWQWEESERAFRRALELEPGSALAHLRYSILLKNQGRFPEAVEALRHARRSDPLSLNVGWNLTHALGLVGDHDAAVAEARQMLELDAGSPRGYGALGTAYAIAGRYSEAIEPLERAEELAENGGPGNWLAISYAGVGRLEDARAIRDRLIATQGGTEMRPFNVASAHVALGEIDEAFRVLERAERERNGMLGRVGWWRGVPAYRAVTRDPRYTRLLDRIGLPH